MRDSTDEILTIKEASQFLKIGKTTLYKLARNDEIPARKVGREWRFVRSQLLEWMEEREKRNTTSGVH